MSNYKLVTIDQRFIAETIARTGTYQILEKASRNYVGLYNEEENWYIPLRAKIKVNKIPNSFYYETPFQTENPHFRNPGLDFQKALYVPTKYILDIENTLPKEQSDFIFNHQQEIQNKFEEFVLLTANSKMSDFQLNQNTVNLFPEGIEKIKQLQQRREEVKQELKSFTLNNVREETKPTVQSVEEENNEEMGVEKKEEVQGMNLQTALANKDYKFLKEHLERGIENYLDSDTYKKFLSCFSSFNDYSQKNMRLLLAQMPTATMVATASEWKNLGRFPSKGTKALRIYGPNFEYKKDEEGNYLKDDKGKKIPTGNIAGWKLVPVFDVSQTHGKELPKPIYELTENFKEPKHFLSIFNAVKSCTTASISLQEISREGVKGFYNRDTHSIVIRKGMNQYQTLKTEIHEVAHSLLHQKDSEFISKEQKEFEAESVAYIVCQNYGVDTSDYTFAYLSSWTNKGERIADFENSLKIITNTAREIIKKIDKELSQELTIKENKVEERTNKFSIRLQNAQRQLGNPSEKSVTQSIENVNVKK